MNYISFYATLLHSSSEYVNRWCSEYSICY